MKFLYLFFLLSLLSGCDDHKKKEKESTRLTYESKKLLQENKLKEARQVLEKSIELDPANYAAYTNRAYLNIEENRSSEEILGDFSRALKIKPDYETALSSLANYYFEIKDYDNTIKNTAVYLDYSIKEKFDQKTIQHIYAISGESKYMIRKFDAAISDLRIAISFDPADAGAHKNLGDCYFYKGSIGDAIQELTKAINLEDNYYQPYLGRARCYEASGPFESKKLAEQDYISAFKINPKMEDIYFTNSPLFKKYKKIN